MDGVFLGQLCEWHAKEISMMCVTDGEGICVSCVSGHKGHKIETLKQQQIIATQKMKNSIPIQVYFFSFTITVL